MQCCRKGVREGRRVEICSSAGERDGGRETNKKRIKHMYTQFMAEERRI